MEPAAVKRSGVDDLLSGLPDELLHMILLRLPTIAAAARTSALSRRWRRVWTYLPELDLGGSPAPATTPSAALLDPIDAVVKSYSAPTLHRLMIVVSDETDEQCGDVPAHRVAPWLRFASQRLAGRLYIRLPYSHRLVSGEELSLPVCDRATEIDINMGRNFVLRPPATGSFTALTVLSIWSTEVDCGELGRVISTQCPRLQKLNLLHIWFVAAKDACTLSIRSESLECLRYHAGGLDKVELEVTAPMLLEISVGCAAKAYIVAPKLEKVEWESSYNPGHHQFAVAPRHLRSLSIMYSPLLSLLISSTWLMQRFDTVNELKVSLAIHEGITGYMSFLTEVDKLPACETLIIHLFKNNHALAPMMLPLLRRCSCIRKLELLFDWRIPSEYIRDTITIHHFRMDFSWSKEKKIRIRRLSMQIPGEAKQPIRPLTV